MKATEIIRVTPRARERLMTIKARTKQTPAEQIDNFLFGDDLEAQKNKSQADDKEKR